MRQDKHLLLDEVTESLQKFDHFFVMRYGNLNANQANSFRNEVAKKGGDVHILRKRLFSKAAVTMGYSMDHIPLEGHIGLVFASGDPVEMCKALIQFGKENNDTIALVGGRVDSQVLGQDQVAVLSKLPGKAEMQAQLLATFEAPLSQTLSVMEALISSVVYCLDNKVKKEGGEDTPAESA
ncbi:MAG: 50S ribosomal protein L10 [Parachlamydiales bacterium]|jgi:large subunit ribosomal protein L10